MKTIEPATLTSATFEDLVREMLVRLGEDPQREGLAATPERVRKAMTFLTKGYNEDPEALLKGALFTVTADSGAADHPDRRDDPESNRATRRRRRHRSAPLVHDDARGGKAALCRRDLFDAGLLPQ